MLTKPEKAPIPKKRMKPSGTVVRTPARFIEDKVIGSIQTHAAIMLENNRILFATSHGGADDKYMWLARGILVGEVYSHIARINHEYVQSIRRQSGSEVSHGSERDASKKFNGSSGTRSDMRRAKF